MDIIKCFYVQDFNPTDGLFNPMRSFPTIFVDISREISTSSVYLVEVIFYNDVSRIRDKEKPLSITTYTAYLCWLILCT